MPVTFPCTDKDGNHYKTIVQLSDSLHISTNIVGKISRISYVKNVDMLIDLCLLNDEMHTLGVRLKFTEDFVTSRFEYDNCNPDKKKFPQRIDDVVFVNEQHMGRYLGLDSTSADNKVRNLQRKYGKNGYTVKELYDFMKSNKALYPEIFPSKEFSSFFSYAEYYGLNNNRMKQLIDKNIEFFSGIEDFVLFAEYAVKDGITNKSLGKFLLHKGINRIDEEPLVFVDLGVSFPSLASAAEYFKFKSPEFLYRTLSGVGVENSPLREKVKVCKSYKQFIENDELARELGYASINELISFLCISSCSLFAVYYKDCNSDYNLFKEEIMRRSENRKKVNLKPRIEKRSITQMGIFNPKDVETIREEGVLRNITKDDLTEIKMKGLSYGDIYRLFYVYKDLDVCKEVGKWIIDRRKSLNLNKQNNSKFITLDLYNVEDLGCEEVRSPISRRAITVNLDENLVKNEYPLNLRRASYFYINGLYLVPNLSEGCKRFGIPVYRLDNEVSIDERERIFTENYISYRMSKCNGIITAFLRIEACVYDDCYRCEFYNQIVYLSATDIIWLRVLTANMGVSTGDIGVYKTIDELCNFYSLPTDYYYVWLSIAKKWSNLALYLLKRSNKLWEDVVKNLPKEEHRLIIHEPKVDSAGDLKLKRRVFDSIRQAYKRYNIYLDISIEKTNEEHIKYIEDILLKREEMKLVLFDIVFDSMRHVTNSLGVTIWYLKKGIEECTKGSKPLNFKDLENWLLTKYYTRGSLKRNPDRKVGNLEIKRYSFTDSDGLDWFSVIDWDRGVMKNMSSTDLMLKKVELCKERMQNEQ